MKAVTIREAKARLNALVEAAERGEQVVLVRGSKHVAAIVPLSEDDLELAPSLTDARAERLWRQLDEERREGTTFVYEGVAEAVPASKEQNLKKIEDAILRKNRRRVQNADEGGSDESLSMRRHGPGRGSALSHL